MADRFQVLIEVASQRASGLEANLRARRTVRTLVDDFPGLELDANRRSVPFERPRLELEPESGVGGPLVLRMSVQGYGTVVDHSRLLRASLPLDSSVEMAAAMRAAPGVNGVFASPPVHAAAVCHDSPARGSDSDAMRILGSEALAKAGMDGQGSTVAVADSGINVAYLKRAGRRGSLDLAGSFAPTNVRTPPGSHRTGHGTMCAYQVGLAAPSADLGDCPVLRSEGDDLSAWLSDIVDVFTELRAYHRAQPTRPLIVSNSWAVIDPDLDFPPDDEGNYTDNPRHPLNVLISGMDAEGIDLVFAAGNCGLDCGDHCGFGTDPAINGANSHPRVLCVGAADIGGERAGYSSVGPGRIDAEKPDIVAPSHYVGSRADGEIDGGTSTACPAVAGVIAAVRTRFSAARLSPEDLRQHMRETARRPPATGHDMKMGWGMVDGEALLRRLASDFGDQV